MGGIGSGHRNRRQFFLSSVIFVSILKQFLVTLLLSRVELTTNQYCLLLFYCKTFFCFFGWDSHYAMVSDPGVLRTITVQRTALH